MTAGDPGRLRLSLVVNTRNEARNLAGLLDSAPGVDEIVVADMESSDSTLAIARRRGARILPLPNAGCCEPGRQAALDAATGDWLLVLDADERLSQGGVEKLRSLAAASPPEVSAFRFTFRVFVGTTRVLRSGWEVPLEMHARLFRRGRVGWPPEIHASPVVEGRIVDVPEDDVWVDHHNFSHLEHFIDKVNRYSTIEADLLVRRGEAPTLLEGLREGFAELRRRYSPVEDGALSFALSLGILLYRLLVHAKAQERLGWPEDAVPTSEALRGAVTRLEEALRAETVRARPAGARDEAGSAGAAASNGVPVDPRRGLGRLRGALAAGLRTAADRIERRAVRCEEGADGRHHPGTRSSTCSVRSRPSPR